MGREVNKQDPEGHKRLMCYVCGNTVTASAKLKETYDGEQVTDTGSSS